MSDWDQTIDLLVIGSGAAGMAAAIRAHDLGSEVEVFEKSEQWGGSTAMSGGVCWVGNNPHMREVGINDSDEEVLEYLRAITKGEVSEERLQTYVSESKRVLGYLEEKSHVRFKSLALYTDYYPEAPGGKSGGRSMDPVPFFGPELGEDFRDQRRPHPQSQIMGKFGITAAQAHYFLVRSWKTLFVMLWMFFKFFIRGSSRKKYGRDTMLTAGNALTARLRKSLQDRDVPVWLSSPVNELIIEDGRVVGAVVTKTAPGSAEGTSMRIRARQGVLLAAGGFERNQAMRDKYLPLPSDVEWSAANPANEGDGIRMGLSAGADTALMDEAWWTPATLVPKSDVAWVLVVEKSLPGGIFVDNNGKRFVNEAAPYIDVVHDTYEANDEVNSAVPAWIVFDARFRHNFPAGPIAPGYAMPDSRTPRRYRSWLLRASTLEELAEKISVPADNLLATVERFNANAVKGEDPDFGRGISLSDQYYGDYRVKPNPCLGPVQKAPFYAFRVVPGDLGTKGGMVTDTGARALDTQGKPIPGLYAAGNNSASVMGRSYPGAGGTIGPAMTFGFLAAETAKADLSATSGADATEAAAAE